MNVVPSFIYHLLRHPEHPVQTGPSPTEPESDPGPELAASMSATRHRERRESFGRIAPRPAVPAPYETPDPSGKCWVVDLPEEVLVKVFKGLDGVSLARCMRVCRTIHDLLTTNPHLALQNLLSFSSLCLNPHAVTPSPSNLLTPPSPAELLARLRDKLDRFARLDPARTVSMRLQESEGRLYEYLEGILLKSVGQRTTLPTTVGIYDVRGVGEVQAGLISASSADNEDGEEDGDGMDDDWADVEEGEEIVEKIRRTKTFGFTVAEFAVDPGQDLLVLVEVLAQPPRQYQIRFHLLSLETLEPHPLASQPTIDWPTPVGRRDISLGFQICDDGLYVLNHNQRSQANDQLYGWQWTTCRLAVTLTASPTQTFESFILLSPNSFLVPSIITHLDMGSHIQDDLTDPSDLSWTHHIHLYAFPPLSSVPTASSEPFPPPHTATHIATFDLPKFIVDLEDEMPPPRMTIRTDPPPRHTFPTHPVDSVQPFVPTPESGVIIMEFYCQMPDDNFPRYVLACPKRTLIQYLPAPTSPLLTQGFPRQAPVIKWETLAPKVRMFGPDMVATSWVCYVYQDRYAASTSSRRDEDDPQDFDAKVRLYDFNPLRVRKEVSRRTSVPPISANPLKRRSSSSSASIAPIVIDGQRNGITLITRETKLRGDLPLSEEIRTGSEFPYMFAEKDSQAEVWLLDNDRLIGVFTPDIEGKSKHAKPRIEVMEF